MPAPDWLAASRLRDASARGLASYVAELIRAGDLSPGETLPPVRTIAQTLRVSPATVSSAWTVLKRRGLLKGVGRTGIRVLAPADLAQGRDFYSTVPGGSDLRLLYPDVRLLPPLGKALAAAAELPNLNEYYGYSILPSLQEVVHPSWPYPAGAYMVSNGGSDALWTLLQSSTVPGDRIVMETPTQPQLLPLMEELGLTIVPVRYTAGGLDLAELAQALKTRPAVIFFQPRAQIPTGQSTSKRRAAEMIRLLKELPYRPLVIEYDDLGDLARTEHHSVGRILPDQVVTIRSYEKSYGPDLRLAVIGSSEAIMRIVHPRIRHTRQWTSRILQGTLAWLLRDPPTQKLLEEARQLYGHRLDSFVEALRDCKVSVTGADGFCAWVSVVDEQATAVDLTARGVLVFAAGSKDGEPDQHIRVATSRLESNQVQVLAEQIAHSSRLFH